MYESLETDNQDLQEKNVEHFEHIKAQDEKIETLENNLIDC